MFASHALAARIEAGEARLSTSLARSARTDGGGRSIVPVAGGVAVFARPGSPVNKVIGCGFGEPLDDAALAAIEAWWWQRGEAVRFELATLADPALPVTLTTRGYRLRGFENVLGRSVGDADRKPAPGVAVELVTAASIDAWRDAMLTGFATPDDTGAAPAPLSHEVLAEALDDFLRATDHRRYLATVDGVAAGAAAARFDDGLAQLAGAATIPAFRRRGVQRALLAARLAAARVDGGELAIVTTAPGSQSQANVMTLGFELLYARAVLVREPPPFRPGTA